LTRDLQIKHLVKKLRESSTGAIPKDEDRKHFSSILNRVEKAAEKRNDLLHSLWTFQGQSVRRLNKKRPHLEDIPTVHDIDLFNGSLLEIANDLAEFQNSEPLKSPVIAALEEYTRQKNK
jgi:hypothetical protein